MSEMYLCFECKVCGTLDIVNKDYQCEKCWIATHPTENKEKV